ncbi:MAG: helix-turn-helix transcriptional regulator [Clostridia bacterium]|nr:helix-turn-helix transcriptional regulator [Clostridia bacterium]MBQ9513788.1 helix-turn-helix transcriptional regulator [Clostridia bacterium]
MVKIKELRTELSLTQKQFAEKLNLDAHNIGDWERGKGEPNSDMLIKISNVFNVSTDYLLGLEDDFGVKQFDGSPSPVSQDELLLIKKLRALNLSTQEAFRIQINAMYEKEAKGEKV